jgi:hypothetical protein
LGFLFFLFFSFSFGVGICDKLLNTIEYHSSFSSSPHVSRSIICSSKVKTTQEISHQQEFGIESTSFFLSHLTVISGASAFAVRASALLLMHVTAVQNAKQHSQCCQTQRHSQTSVSHRTVSATKESKPFQNAQKRANPPHCETKSKQTSNKFKQEQDKQQQNIEKDKTRVSKTTQSIPAKTN